MKQGGKRTFPLTNSSCDDRGTVEGTRLATEEDIEQWRNSEASKGIDCAGESKLPPTAYNVYVHRDRIYTLLRARCRPTWSYRKHPGMALILDSWSGKEVYVKRELLEVVS